MALEKGETANLKGRPPKLATTIIRELKEQGSDRVGRAEVDELIARLQNLPREKLLEFVNAAMGQEAIGIVVLIIREENLVIIVMVLVL